MIRIGLVVGAIFMVVAGLMLAIGWLRWRRGTELSFDVGEREHHHVAMFYSKFSGRLVISVDGDPVISKTVTLSLTLLDSYEFTVGDAEPHVVRIDKHRERLFPAFRRQPLRGYVDGKLVAEAVA